MNTAHEALMVYLRERLGWSTIDAFLDDHKMELSVYGPAMKTRTYTIMPWVGRLRVEDDLIVECYSTGRKQSFNLSSPDALEDIASLFERCSALKEHCGPPTV